MREEKERERGMHSPKHLDDLRILLTILFEGELTLLIVVLVLSTSSVLSSFSLILGHVCGLGLSGKNTNASGCGIAEAERVPMLVADEVGG